MDELTIRALYASVVEDEGTIFIGFAEGEDETEPYVLIRQEGAGAPIWFEVADESLGAEDAVEKVVLGEKGLTFVIAADKIAKIGGAAEVPVQIGPATEDADQAIEALRDMFGTRFEG